MNSPSQHASLEIFESLMLRRILIKVPIVQEPPQKSSYFRPLANHMGRYVKVVIESSSMDNLLALEMVERLNKDS